MKLKLFAMVIVLVNFLFITGCNNISYNAQLYDNINDYINEDFAKETIIRDVYYVNHDDITIIQHDDTVPSDRTFIVTDKESYDEMFNENIDYFDVNFTTQMLIIYTFRAINHRELNLTNISLQDSSLTVEYKSIQKNGIGDTSTPYQRWIAVKLDKINIMSISFKQK